MNNKIYELDDTSKVKHIFDGWNETLIFSCVQKVMGKIYVTDLDNPKSAFAYVGCFGFYAGEPEKELVLNKPDGFVIMIPQNEAWAKLIEECFKTAKRVTRYAIKKNTIFNEELLRRNVSMLPAGYELKKIDSDIYDKCLDSPDTADFVSAFESKEQYLSIGKGYVITKNDMIVAGASSYTRYLKGIEIEVDTVYEERRKHLATIVCSALILHCLEEGLYPSWDAQNMDSVHLAEKLGYEYDHEYVAYEVASDLIYCKAQSSDFDRLNELFIEMLMTIYNTDQVNGYSEGDMDRFFDGRDEWVCKVTDDDYIIAFLSIEVHHEEEEYIYLDDLSVTMPYRNKGIGTSLIERAEEYAKEIGIHRIYFHVEKANTSAFKLYQRLGYTINEEQESRYLMRKEI